MKSKPESSPEAIEYFEKLRDDPNMTWCQKIDAMCEYKKQHENFIGINGITVIPEKGKTTDPEKVAHCMFLMMLKSAKGECEDVTHEYF